MMRALVIALLLLGCSAPLLGCSSPSSDQPPTLHSQARSPATPTPTPTTTATAKRSQRCEKPRKVQTISFSATKYSHIRQHVLTLNRRGADARRDRLLAHYPTRSTYDRDEYPPAIGRGYETTGANVQGTTAWKASVAYVPSDENRSHGAVLGIKLRRFCDGTRFRYVFY
jgi:hypothetical protein